MLEDVFLAGREWSSVMEGELSENSRWEYLEGVLRTTTIGF
jgi:hypothetical protein